MHELFNLKRDIGETNNLHLEYPEKVKELQEVMLLYQALKVKKWTFRVSLMKKDMFFCNL